MNFDTLSFAKRLTEAGEKEAVAEAHALALKEFVVDNLATRDDLYAVRDELNNKIDSVRDELNNKIDQEITLVRRDMDALGERLEQRIENLGLNLTVRMGGMLVVAVGLLATLNKIL